MAIKKKFVTEAVNDYPPIRDSIPTEISDYGSLLFDPPCRNPVKSVPRGKAIWNANGGFVSVLLTHLCLMFGLPFLFLLNARVCQTSYFMAINYIAVTSCKCQLDVH